MKRSLSLLLLLAALSAATLLSAQTPPQEFGVSKVESDELVAFIRAEITPEIYFVKDPADNRNYTVRAPKEQFLEKALAALREGGYQVWQYDGKYIVVRDGDLRAVLPAGYFARQEAGKPAVDSALYQDRNVTMTFQNKIYEIGDPERARKSGKATVRGYVRDAASGEPIVGVSVYDESGKSFATTDEYGYYKLTLPVGAGKLGFSGYSLEDLKLDLMVYDDGGLDVVMKEKVFSLKGAVITSESMSQHRTSQLGIEKVRINMIKNVPVVFGEADALKVVMTLPGVKSVGEASSGFNVRGGATDQNLILFNGGTIYNPNHMFGILSAFNPDVISV